MSLQTERIFLAALRDTEAVTDIVGDRIYPIAIPGDEMDVDNTPVPYIVVTFDGFTNVIETKDNPYEGSEDKVQIGITIAADSPDEVRQLVRLVRQAIETHVVALYGSGEQTPMLEALSSDGIQWDWMKPCYFQRLTYQCLTPADNEEDN
jgi:hypothetical protein